MNPAFIGKALKPNPKIGTQFTVRSREWKDWQKKEFKLLKAYIDLASSYQEIFDDPNDFWNNLLIRNKWALRNIRKADYYTFDIVKKDFHLGGSDYYKKTEIRDNIISDQIRKAMTLCGVRPNEYLRPISAPNFRNRLVQIYIQHLFNISINKGWFKISEKAHGFVNERNSKSNALEHFSYHFPQIEDIADEEIRKDICQLDIPESMVINHMKFRKDKNSPVNFMFTDTKLYDFHLDLENFFPSWSRSDVIKYMTRFTNRNVARKIANVSCKNGKLVQGSVISPLLTNLMMYDLDTELQNFCKKYDICYTRYADDMLFTSKRKIDKTLSFKIISIIKRHNLKLAEDKVGFSTNIIDVNGLKLNMNLIREGKDPVRVSQKFYKRTKYLVKIYNRAVARAIKYYTWRTGFKLNGTSTKVVRKSANGKTFGIYNEQNLRSVSLGNAAYITLAKRYFTARYNRTWLAWVVQQAKTGINIVSDNQLEIFNRNLLIREERNKKIGY